MRSARSVLRPGPWPVWSQAGAWPERPAVDPAPRSAETGLRAIGPERQHRATGRSDDIPGLADTSAWLVGVAYGAGRFVIVGDGGTIFTSDDNGDTWIARASGVTTRLNAAAYGNGIWLVVGESGVVLASTNGATWTPRPALGRGFLRALAFGQGRFLIGGASGALYTTTDGLAFTAVPLPTTANIEAAAISESHFWVVGSQGLWASATQLGSWSLGPAISTATFRGVAARSADEAVAIAEVGAAVFRHGVWATVTAPPPFLATAVVQGEDEMIAVGFAGGIARADVTPQPAIVGGLVEYGTDVKLVYKNSSALAYQWYTGAGVPIPGATTPELHVPRVTPANNFYGLEHSTPPIYKYYSQVTIALYPAGQPEVRDPGFVSALPRSYFWPYPVVVQPDGKLLVTGSFSVAPGGLPSYGVARLQADGSLDHAFRAGDGISPLTTINAMHLLPDGRIYVRGSFTEIGGQTRPRLARLFGNGSIDPGFTPDPDLLSFIVNSALAPDGRLFVQTRSGNTAAIAMLSLDGSRDTTFAPLAAHELIAVDAHGRLLALRFPFAHSPQTADRLLRYLPDGRLDPTYSQTAVRVSTTITHWESELWAPFLTDAGLYATAGSYNRVGGTRSFIRYKPDGGRDPSYVSPPSIDDTPTGSGSSFSYLAGGSLCIVREDRANRQSRAEFYTPDGLPDPTRFASRRDRQLYWIRAVAPDGSFLTVTSGTGTSTSTGTFERIRPIVGTPGRLTNLSVRAFVASANEPLITGFVTGGSGPTRALVRAIGPGLAQFGIGDAMQDPRLTLTRDGTLAATNDSWDESLAPSFARVGAFPLAPGSKDAALDSPVADGNHTVVIAPAPGDSGTGLVELYETADLSVATRRFVNVSARGPVTTTRPLIVGFTIAGDVPVRVLIRAAGPALTQFGVSAALADPRLALFRSGAQIWENDNWTSRGNSNGDVASLATRVGAFSFTSDSLDAAMMLDLAPGGYTAVVSSANTTGGTALVEVYEAR